MQYYNKRFKRISIFTAGSIIMCIKLIMQYASRLFVNNIIIDNALIFFALGFFILDFIIHSKYTLRQLILIACFGIICLYTCIKAKDYNMLITYFWVISAINYRFDSSLYIIHKTKVYLILICIVISAIVTIVTGNNILTVNNAKGAYFIFGFTHPNTIALLCFWCTVEYSYLSYKKNKHKKTEANMLALNILFFLLFGSKTAIIGAFIWTIGMNLIRRDKVSSKFLRFLGMSIFPITGLVFFAFVYAYGRRGGAMYNLSIFFDKIITGRVRMAARLHDIYGETILGQFVQRGSSQWDSYYQLNAVTIDGMFASFLVQIGLVYFILVSIGIFKVAKNGDVLTQMLIIVYTYYALSEVGVLNGFLAFPLLMIGFKCLKNESRKKVICEAAYS